MTSLGFSLPKGPQTIALVEQALPGMRVTLAEEERISLALYDTEDHFLLRRHLMVAHTPEGFRRFSTRECTLGSTLIALGSDYPLYAARPGIALITLVALTSGRCRNVERGVNE